MKIPDGNGFVHEGSLARPEHGMWEASKSSSLKY